MFNFRKSKKVEAGENQNIVTDKEEVIQNNVEFGNETFEMYMSQLPETINLDDNKLIEIADKKVLTRLMDLAPQLKETIILSKNVSAGICQKMAPQLFEIKIPQGLKLGNSHSLLDTKKGLLFKPGEKGIKGSLTAKNILILCQLILWKMLKQQ